MDAYPLQTKPHFRDYLWGGRKLETVLGKPIPEEGIWAESWEVIDHSEHQSEVTNGELAGRSLQNISVDHADWLFGSHSDRPDKLPLLFKYLDCQRVLSVQVHPDDEYGSQMPTPDLGKTEAWYIVAAEPGSKLYAGLKQGTTADQLRASIDEGSVEKLLHAIEPAAGDCVFIPAGTVHALGAGLLVAEIQQASNTTFRLFDWNRIDVDGNPRQLHVEQAMEVIDFSSGPRVTQTPQATDQPGRERLVECEKFVFDRLTNVASGRVGGDGQLHLLSAPMGGVELKWQAQSGEGQTRLAKGETVVLPAALPKAEVSLASGVILLDMYLP